MNPDSYFTIGRTHKVCEDYARSGYFKDGRAYAIVSDGCSSSPDTDFGARLLTMAARNQMNLPENMARTIAVAREMVPSGLHPNCTDATLLAAREVAHGVAVTVCGDGVVIALSRDGVWDRWDFDYNGAPGYLSYMEDPDRWARYVDLGWNKRPIHYSTPDGTDDSAHLTLQIEDLPWPHFFGSTHYETIFLFTDGVHSFQRDTGVGMESVPMGDVVEQITALRSTKGEFVQRRCTAFERRFCTKNRWHHNDDFGVAAIWMGEPDEKGN